MSTNSISVLSLLIPATVKQVFDLGLDAARALGLDVDAWQVGDPTRAGFQFYAQAVTRLEETYAAYVGSGFLSTAEGDWLKVKASEDYDVEAQEATFATPSVFLSNPSAFVYTLDGPGDFKAKATSTGKTFASANTSPIALPSGAVDVEIPMIAEQSGSDSSVAADEIDEIITTLVGVVISGSSAAGAQDDARPEAVREQCAAAAAATSPNGPLEAYEFVARNSALTLAVDVTRARAAIAGTGGLVDVYVAGTSGPVIAASVTLVQTAIEKWATPLGFTPTARNATARTVDVAATVRGTLPAGYETLISAAIVGYFASVKIGGRVARSKIHDDAHDAVDALESIEVTSFSSDVELLAGEVPVLGSLTLTEAV